MKFKLLPSCNDRLIIFYVMNKTQYIRDQHKQNIIRMRHMLYGANGILVLRNKYIKDYA